MSGRTGILAPPGAIPVPEEPRELTAIRRLVVLMGAEVDRAITHAVCGLVDRDLGICAGVIGQRARLRALQGELRRRCATTGLERDPESAGMREAVALLHIAAELERIGDHCAAIARIGQELAALPEPGGHPGLTRMADVCGARAREVLLAVGTPERSRALAPALRDDRLERLCRELLGELAGRLAAEPSSVARATRVLVVARLLERIADRVVTIAEDLVLAGAGAVELPGLHAEAVSGR